VTFRLDFNLYLMPPPGPLALTSTKSVQFLVFSRMTYGSEQILKSTEEWVRKEPRENLSFFFIFLSCFFLCSSNLKTIFQLLDSTSSCTLHPPCLVNPHRCLRYYTKARLTKKRSSNTMGKPDVETQGPYLQLSANTSCSFQQVVVVVLVPKQQELVICKDSQNRSNRQLRTVRKRVRT
jgi:hypothetical protein